MNQTATLRQSINAQRRTLSTQTRIAAERQVCAQLVNSKYFLRAKKVAVYYPVGGEVGTFAFVKRCWQAGKQVYLPVLFNHDVCPLLFALFTPSTALVLNQFKIPEPDSPFRAMLKPNQLDLVCAPLVAFNEQGQRLGMGGGYYDRSFSFLRRYQRPRMPYLLGLAYEFQNIATLHAQPWDVPLDATVTPQRIYTNQS